MRILNIVSIQIDQVPSNFHPIASYIDPLAVLGREYGYYLGKLHAKAQDYDAVAERATNEQSSAITTIYGAIHRDSKFESSGQQGSIRRKSRDNFKWARSHCRAVKKSRAEEVAEY